MRVTIYTDPGCPFGFNAQPQETQLLWHYGEGLDVTRRMIVLRENAAPFADVGLSALRRSALSDGEPLDNSATIDAAARDVGIASETLDDWLRDADVRAALLEDMAAARTPEALALPHRLSKSEAGLRYSTASALFEHGKRRIVTQGLQPFAVYEVAIANLAPELQRRPLPHTVREILAWAPYPLATAEVAQLRGIGLDEAAAELHQAGAQLRPAAGDGYWAGAPHSWARWSPIPGPEGEALSVASQDSASRGGSRANAASSGRVGVMHNRGGGVMADDPLNQRVSEQSTGDLMDRWYAAWNAHDVGAIAACLTEDAVLEEPGARGGESRGQDAILAWARATFRAAPDFHLEEFERWITAGGDVIATHFKATGTLTGPFDPPGFAPTNGRLEFEGMDRSEIREGKIARHQIFYDLNGVGRQMGAVPEQGSFGERLGVRMQHLAARRLRKRATARG